MPWLVGSDKSLNCDFNVARQAICDSIPPVQQGTYLILKGIDLVIRDVILGIALTISVVAFGLALWPAVTNAPWERKPTKPAQIPLNEHCLQLAQANPNELNLTAVITMAKQNEIRKIVVTDGRMLTVFPRGKARSVDQFTSRISRGTDLISLLVANGVEIGPNGVEVTFASCPGR